MIMRAAALLPAALLSAAHAAAARRLSKGCGAPPPADVPAGEKVQRSISFSDQRLGEHNRQYLVRTPRNYHRDTPNGVVMYFHGWYAAWRTDCDECAYDDLGDLHGLVTVYPKGMGDGGGVSWNVGNAGDARTCVPQDTEDLCYDSCRALGECGGGCNFATCWNDTKFVSDLVALLGDELCLDLDRVYATGASNGGMFMYTLSSAVPGLLAGASPVYGSPLRHHLPPPAAALSRVAWIHIHGMRDCVIPIDGGEASCYDGWLYNSMVESVEAVGRGGSCGPPRRLHTPWDGDNQLECAQLEGCRVVSCHYSPGWHGSWPRWMEELQLWWWLGGPAQWPGRVSSAAANSTSSRAGTRRAPWGPRRA